MVSSHVGASCPAGMVEPLEPSSETPAVLTTQTYVTFSTAHPAEDRVVAGYNPLRRANGGGWETCPASKELASE